MRQYLRIRGVITNVSIDGFHIGGDYDSLAKIQRIADKHPNSINPLKSGLKAYITCTVFKQPTFLNNQSLSNAINRWNELEGRKAEIKVYVRQYSFESKFEHNKGQLIQGFKLMLYELKIID